MNRRIRRVRIAKFVTGTILVAAFTWQMACSFSPSPPEPPQPPDSAPVPTEGVSAKQVQDLLTQELDTLNRDLTLWNIQPGLGTVMIEYGRRFAMMQLAAQAGDWGMAQYQLKEATEIQEVGEITRPANADLLKDFEHGNLDALAEDILAEDIGTFNTDVASTIEACNACHVATGHPYVVVRPPAASPQDFLFFGASDSVASEESSSNPTETQASDDPLSWAELTQMVDESFDMVNRDLSLWNIQPGLGTVMMEYGRRFAMLPFAVDAGDWGMAQYQLKEQIEIQEVGETTRPAKSELLADFEHGFLDPISAAIENEDTAAFNSAYADAIDGCNACHVATGHPYVQVQMPPNMPQPFLMLGSSALTESTGENNTAAPEDNFPSTNPTLADAQALIEDRLNTLDRTLALWNIQPGLGTVMMEYGYRFALARLAVDSSNWGMAAYQIKEATEIQEVGEITRPNNAPLLKGFEQSSLDPLNAAIDAQDQAQFDAAFSEAINGCNGCHQATGHPYVVVQPPPQNLVDFLDLAAGAGK